MKIEMQKKCVFDKVFQIEVSEGFSLVRNYRAYNTGQVDGWKAYLGLFLSTAEYRKGSFDDAE